VAEAEGNSQADPTAPKALDNLKWREGYFRVNAFTAIGRLIPESRQMESRAIPVLRKGLTDEQGWVPRAAADVLGLIGNPAQVAVPELVQLLKKESNSAAAAARALAKIDPVDSQVADALRAA
jgi:HEAT repeat protein